MQVNSSLSHRDQEPEKGVLYIVGTPIGNLSDISFRAINILKNVFLIACEDTRQTRKLLNKFDFKNNLVTFNQHNSFKKIPSILNKLKSGKSIALVSDAGLPGISDPGEDLVKRAKLVFIDVICIPGPCAALTALVSSGIPSSKFIFEGFLPKKKSERKKILLEISKNEKSTIIYEAPHRLMKLLSELKEYCGGLRELDVARELTKKHEQHIGPNINEAIEFFKKNQILGEFTITLKGIEKTNDSEFNELDLKKELHNLLDAGLSLSSASRYLAKEKNVKKSDIYKLH